jgi:predicted ribosomally synthesized peptide with SipW-like signal peptide
MKLKGTFSALALVIFAASLAAGATGAFFADTETATGNTFTAGELDLLVDSSAHYNDVICLDVENDGNADGPAWIPEAVTFWDTEDAQHELSINQNDLPQAIEDFNEANPTHYPKAGTPCGESWILSDLGPTFKFFNYADLKPGDEGENTISIHVDTNDSYVCAIIDNMEDNDLGLTEPEMEVDNDSGNGNGELSQEVQFFAWNDDGDNLWEDGEQALFSNISGPASDVLDGVVYPLYTPDTLGVLPGNQTAYVGLYWCYGDLTVNTTTETLTCDGSAVTNLTQSDQLKADITFYAEQARHNGEFECPLLEDVGGGNNGGEEPVLQTVEVRANDLAIDLSVLAAHPERWFFFDDVANTLNNTIGSFVAGTSTPIEGTGSARMTVTGTERKNIATIQYAGMPLAAAPKMSFATHSQKLGDGDLGATERAPYLHFNVDFTGVGVNPAFQGRMVFVPRENSMVVSDTWQTWNTASSSLWWWSGYAANGNKWPDNDTDEYRTWSDIVSSHPGIRMHPSLPFLGVRVGEPYANGFTGYVDFFSMTVNESTTLTNFEN